MKYSISLGRTGYVRHMTNSLLTPMGNGSFLFEVLFEGVPVQYLFTDTGIDNAPEHMTPAEWEILCEKFDQETRQIVHDALTLAAERKLDELN